MKLADGILVTLRKKRRKRLKPVAKQAVLDFYENDEYSQQMPDKEDYVNISLNVHKQSIFFHVISKSQECEVKNRDWIF